MNPRHPDPDPAVHRSRAPGSRTLRTRACRRTRRQPVDTIPTTGRSNVTSRGIEQQAAAPHMEGHAGPAAPNVAWSRRGWDPALERYMRPIADFGIDALAGRPDARDGRGRRPGRGRTGRPARVLERSRPRHRRRDGHESAFAIAGFAWEDRSVVGDRPARRAARRRDQHLASKGVPTEVLRLTGRPKAWGATSTPTDGARMSRSPARRGATRILRPRLAERAGRLRDLVLQEPDGSVDISAPPTKVTQESCSACRRW